MTTHCVAAIVANIGLQATGESVRAADARDWLRVIRVASQDCADGVLGAQRDFDTCIDNAALWLLQVEVSHGAA